MVACSPAHRAQRKRRQKAQNESTTSSSSSDEERFERRKNKSMSKARNRYLSYSILHLNAPSCLYDLFLQVSTDEFLSR